MFYLNDNVIVLNSNECPNDIDYIVFNVKQNYIKNDYPAIRIDFSDDYNYNKKCIKKLVKLKNKNISFGTKYNQLKVKYIISNYTQEILDSLKLIEIDNLALKYTQIYDLVFKELDGIWEKEKPCKFCDNMCISSRHNRNIHKYDGCCYSFDYPKNPFSFSFTKNVKKCQYLSDDKSCATQNISCKLFVCQYLKKYTDFNLKINDFMLLDCFFSSKQKLILKYNFFHLKEEIINKLMEQNRMPYFIYYLLSRYRIS